MTKTWSARGVDTPSRTDEPIIYKQSPCLSCEHYSTKGWAADKCKETNWKTCPLHPHEPVELPVNKYYKPKNKNDPKPEYDPNLPDAKLCPVCMRWYPRPTGKHREQFAKQQACSVRCGPLYTAWFTDDGLRLVDRNNAIRKMWREEKINQTEIGKRFGLSRYTISCVVNRRTAGRK